MKESLIEIKSLRKRYRKAESESLQGVSFDIFEGEKIGILGPNGAGKTTLISILCGLFSPTSGKVTFHESMAADFPEIPRQKIGLVPQEYAFYSELTPIQNLSYFGAMANLDKEQTLKRSAELLEVLGLGKHARKRIHTFSGGMKRRVNLAIGLLHRPEILFLDEPTVGIDVQSRHAILSFLNDLNEQGITIVYTSHHLSEAEAFCDHIVLLDHGEILADGITKRLLKEYGENSLEDLFIQLTGTEYRDSYV